VGVIDQLASQCGVGPRIHSCCHLGMVMDFLPGRTLEEADVHCGNFKLLDSIAQQLHFFHRQETPKAAEGEPMLWRTMDKVLQVVETHGLALPSLPLAEVRAEIAAAQDALQKLQPKVVCAHGDLKPSNVIENEG
ncbi:unnamed protein product, partial [Effrenium voratum]